MNLSIFTFFNFLRMPQEGIIAVASGRKVSCPVSYENSFFCRAHEIGPYNEYIYRYRQSMEKIHLNQLLPMNASGHLFVTVCGTVLYSR